MEPITKAISNMALLILGEGLIATSLHQHGWEWSPAIGLSVGLGALVVIMHGR